ncbi:uncharacterized protein K452DRAFT_292280 [Aplosporella prunicola CBS 121167]|uniref:Uncharacterized protein n=1 Tax=Aplosporella prunicola CBS 121167 TaxID=1176127 RepID=A0A6A6B009_9PEZI|nr:uncharacterized protein K452DRAFT_292280 [Aplosporella prunicola CBS 121167]KAF2136555.1 hypothetical protein K452DRAFT_292280 [Aplosporella prunicola CBS 121167]
MSSATSSSSSSSSSHGGGSGLPLSRPRTHLPRPRSRSSSHSHSSVSRNFVSRKSAGTGTGTGDKEGLTPVRIRGRKRKSGHSALESGTTTPKTAPKTTSKHASGGSIPSASGLAALSATPSTTPSATPSQVLGKRRRRGRGRPPILSSASQTPGSSAVSSRAGTPSMGDTESCGSTTTTASLGTNSSARAHCNSNETTGAARRKRARLAGVEKGSKRRGARMSRLEQLPVEILEMVFWESGNVDLPAASPVLAAKLGSEQVRMAFCLRALYARYEEEGEAGAAAAALQSKLLARRFFTWDWFTKYAERARTSRAHRAWVDAFMEEETKKGRPEFVDPGALREEYGEGVRTFHERPLADFVRLDLFSWEYDVPRYMRLHKDTKIPEKLLSGPWDAGKALLLRVLVWQALGVDTEHSSAAETVRHGVFAALRGQQMRALDELLWLAQYETGDEPSTAMLRCAVVEAGCPEAQVETLLGWAELKGQVNCYDAAVWAWAEREGGERAEWLKKRLQEADEMIDLRKPRAVG